MMAIGIIFVWYGLLKAENLLFLTTCQYFQERNFLREKQFLVCKQLSCYICFCWTDWNMTLNNPT